MIDEWLNIPQVDFIADTREINWVRDNLNWWKYLELKGRRKIVPSDRGAGNARHEFNSADWSKKQTDQKI